MYWLHWCFRFWQNSFALLMLTSVESSTVKLTVSDSSLFKSWVKGEENMVQYWRPTTLQCKPNFQYVQKSIDRNIAGLTELCAMLLVSCKLVCNDKSARRCTFISYSVSFLPFLETRTQHLMSLFCTLMLHTGNWDRYYCRFCVNL